ncbi:hypothetical protein CHS0354_033086 [Potamilus streckersoni]|uniref:Uncharacterized protein n=1 Tax=Potamilus streckersoni TaxID=2493646 RepID=A0AAE0RZ25_9BIVA|nr:hypothetical protein CHS0354_033086 [Potamilus streckersoni]
MRGYQLSKCNKFRGFANNRPIACSNQGEDANVKSPASFQEYQQTVRLKLNQPDNYALGDDTDGEQGNREDEEGIGEREGNRKFPHLNEQ